jgi:uncharacterized membrane protein
MGFADGLVDFLRSLNLPDWLVVGLIALLPFIEMRGAVPVAYCWYHWSLEAALLYAGIVSLVPGLIIVFYLDRLEPYLRRVKVFDRALTRAFEWTRKKHAEPEKQTRRDRRALILLAILVAIPGPGTGAWTGGLVSYVFEIPKKKAVVALLLGVLGEAIAMAALVLLFDWSVAQLP